MWYRISNRCWTAGAKKPYCIEMVWHLRQVLFNCWNCCHRKRPPQSWSPRRVSHTCRHLCNVLPRNDRAPHREAGRDNVHFSSGKITGCRLKQSVLVCIESVGQRPNKALELTASAWWNVANFHAPCAIVASPRVIGGSSA